MSKTLPPEQKVVAPPAVMVGVAGNGLTVTTVGADVAEHPLPLVTVTVGRVAYGHLTNQEIAKPQGRCK